MAITIITTPDADFVAYRPVFFKVSSNDANITRMKAELLDQASATIATVIKDPLIGTSDNFEFDFQTFLKDQLTFDVKQFTDSGSVDADNSIFKYNVRFTEIILSGSILIDGTSTTPASFFNVLNATLQHEETQNLTAFDLDGNTKKFLTKAPDNKKIGTNDFEFLSCFRSGPLTGSFELSVEQFDINGPSQGVTLIPLTNPTKNRFDIGIGTKNLINEGINFNSTGKYTVHLVRDNVQISEKRTMIIDFACLNDAKRLTFLNGLGGFDSFTFKSAINRSVDIENTLFEKVLPVSFAIKDRGMAKLFQDTQNVFEVTADKLTDADLEWLEELMSSNEVFIDDGTNIIPIIISDGKFRTSEKGGKPNYELIVEYTLSNRIIKQVG